MRLGIIRCVIALAMAAIGFAFQATGEPWKLSGCLRAAPGHYMLTDEITNITAELSGPGLDRESGNRVEVTGGLDPSMTPASGATRFIRVSKIKRLSRNCDVNGKGTTAVKGRKTGGGR